MNRALILLALVSFAAAAAAQNSAQSPAPSSNGVAGMEGTVLQHQTIAPRPSCPISLRAQHKADGNMLKVDKTRPAGVAQRLHLILKNPDSRQIVGAMLKVRGLSGKGRVAGASGANTPDVSRMLDVRFVPGQQNEVTSDVWVPGMTAVLAVELNSVSFADGSRWSLNGTGACSIEPEPLMLIADR